MTNKITYDLLDALHYLLNHDKTDPDQVCRARGNAKRVLNEAYDLGLGALSRPELGVKNVH